MGNGRRGERVRSRGKCEERGRLWGGGDPGFMSPASLTLSPDPLD
jgi:hypothetical protein